ncbi:MAG: nuclear transport factor 2 family protein [Holophagaceae bacterium]
MSGHPHHALLTRFFEALKRKEGAAMGACYHDAGSFTDPAFGKLTAPEARAMWRMLMGRAQDFEATVEVRRVDDASGEGFWEARYTFSKTGRKVVNRITSRFTFRDGLILDQVDAFDLWAWTRQALGAPGLLLGWTPFLQAKVRGEARKGLAQFMAKEG